MNQQLEQFARSYGWSFNGRVWCGVAVSEWLADFFPKDFSSVASGSEWGVNSGKSYGLHYAQSWGKLLQYWNPGICV